MHAHKHFHCINMLEPREI